jgi:hypothetical protein
MSACGTWEFGKCVTYSNGGPDVLSEENALELNDEEVDELLNITGDALEGLAGNCVVLSGADLGGKTLAKDKVANKLSGGGHAEHGEDSLQDVSVDGNEAGKKDASDSGGERDGSRTGVLPAEERVEEGVVVSQVLTGGSLAVRRLAGSGQVGELVLGVGSLEASLVGDRTVGNVLHSLGVLNGVHGVGGGCLHC